MAINENKNWLTINKIDKTLSCIIKEKKKQNIQITNIKNEGDTTTDSIDIKKKIKIKNLYQ